METKYIRVPFDVEMAKKITNGEVEGRVVTRDGRSVMIFCFGRKGKSPIITLVLVYGNKGEFHPYMLYGRLKPEKEYRFDLMLEIPEYMTFKDGDILYARTNLFWYVFIYMNNGKDKTYTCAALDEKGMLWIENNRVTDNDDILELRLATESEKQKLIDALKASKDPKAKDCLRMLGIEVKPECEFKPFDKVIVRDGDRGKWKADFFSHKIEGNSFPYICVSESHKYCIPYNDQTKHLLGTNDNWEE